MYAISKLVVPTIALLGMVQYCPAPFIPAIVAGGISAADAAGVIGAAAGVAGAVEGGVQAGHSKRDASRVFNSRIKKRQDISNLGLGTAWSDCMSELGSSTLNFSSTDSSTVLVSGMPPACMTLSGILTGVYEEGNPVPMSSDSVSFTNLAPGDIQKIQDALNAHPNYQG
ncbi:hypothetical protein ZTR_05414 [Talaromyces verruculosus]|nr:hypothetical protein ZTR_05414 [Talaromyces verruculosus]